MSAVKAAIIECPDCNGDGHHVEFVGPGRERGFAFVPHELYHPCEACDGRGTILDPTLLAPPARAAWVEAWGDDRPVTLTDVERVEREEPLPW